MNITQSEKGSIIIENNQNEIQGIFPHLFIFKHPRKEKAVILNSSGDPNDERNSFVASIDKGLYVNNEKKEDLSSFFKTIKESIHLNGILPNQEPIVASNPQKELFDQITQYEKMYLFAQAFNTTLTPISYYDDGRVRKEEYLLQFNTVTSRVTLTYYYLEANNNSISHILMSGDIGNISLPLKAYIYDNNNLITHSYQDKFWTR